MRHMIFLFTALTLIGFSLVHFQKEKDLKLLTGIF
jgi:hypothetical protein